MTLSRNAYFRRLGIDVWVRRPAGDAHSCAAGVRTGGQAPTGQARATEQPPAAVCESRPSAAVTVGRADEADAHVDEADLPTEPFRVRCFHYGRVFVAIAEDAWPRRRYLLDVAHALNGFVSAERRDLLFDWPQPGVSVAGGGRAFRAFFGHQTREAEYTLISGARVAKLLRQAVPALTGLVERHVYVLPAAPDAEAKKTLWRLIRDLG